MHGTNPLERLNKKVKRRADVVASSPMKPLSGYPAHLFLSAVVNLSDAAVEEALYDSQAMRRFVEINFGREPVPDETTVCRFREHDLAR